jgi:ferrous iron transport protein B
MEATIALGGNPNCGKTTLFNELTGAHQHVANYPGITVERREGSCVYKGYKMRITDLPGTYSLTAYSMEEVVARDFLVNETPDLTINIVDASNPERNLYLTIQMLELGVPVCIALNMMDLAKDRGIDINAERLSKLLDVPVVPIIARTGHGKKELMDTAAALACKKEKKPPLVISYGQDIDSAILEMEQKICADNFLTDIYPSRWIAIKYLEKDEQILVKGRDKNPALSEKMESIVERVSEHLQDTSDTYPEAMIADYRYGYIRSVLKQGVMKEKYDKNRLYTSDKLDKVLTHRIAGPVIMLLILFGLYQFIFTFSEIPVKWLDSFFAWLNGLASDNLPDGLVKSLIVSGIISGIGGIMKFVPLIMFMFFGIAFLEDSGYLARVAFMLDRIFRIFGLHGSSVMPFIVSGGIAGGCAVPGIMAARTLKSPRERLATLLTVPFMNCGAKMPVYALLIAAFFSQNKGMIMFLLTLISWSGALLAAKILRMTVIKGEASPFVMELPTYLLPTFKGLVIHTYERTWQYMLRARTILTISIILWGMMNFPGLPDSEIRKFEQQRNSITQSDKDQLGAIDAAQAEAGLRYSIAGRIGTALESISWMAGFDWRTNIALVGGFAAKEIVVSTMGTAYSLGSVDPEHTDSLSETLAKSPRWSPLTAFSLLIFTMFYAPCFMSVVCIVKEAGSWKWGIFSMIFNTILAFALAVLVFQIGSLI